MSFNCETSNSSMNFIEHISTYILGNLTIKDLPEIGLIALNENMESESIYILAGMNQNDNPFEILQYFDKALQELNILLPSKIEAAKNLTKYYLKEIIKNPNKAFELMNKLNNEVYMQFDWQNNEKKYIGEELKIEHLFTWYREIQDWNDNGLLLYHNNLSREEQLKKLKENLVIEAQSALKNNYS